MGKYSAARDLDLTNQTTWYVVASRSDALIYKDYFEKKFDFVDHLVNPRGRKKTSELESDRPGRNSSSGLTSGGHMFEHSSSHHEAIAKKFAKKIGELLDKACQEDRIGKLVVAAEPHFLGLLRSYYSHRVKKKIIHEIAHEYTHEPPAKLEKHLRQSLKKVSLGEFQSPVPIGI